MSILLVADSNVLPSLVTPINILFFENTLLGIPPKELVNLINCESLKIAKYKRKIDVDNCMHLHNECDIRCHVLCHLCENNIAVAHFDHRTTYDKHNYACCASCIIGKKYENCLICNKQNWDAIILVKYSYVHEKLPFEIHPGYFTGFLYYCDLCYDLSDDSCIMCHRKDNLIKCYHNSLCGKKTIYFCNNLDCGLKPFKNAINEKLTAFENPADRFLIEQRMI